MKVLLYREGEREREERERERKGGRERRDKKDKCTSHLVVVFR